MDKVRESVRRLILAINEIDGLYYCYARRLGANENTVALLYAIDDGKPHSQKEISEKWIIPRTTINSIVKKMTADGFIELVPAEHTKEKEITLTESGKLYAASLLNKIYNAEDCAAESAFENCSDELICALERFAAAMRSRLETAFESEE